MVVLLVGGAVSLTTFLVGYEKDLKSAIALLSSVEGEVRGLRDAVTSLQYATQDRWTGTDMKLWASELSRLNRDSVVVPPVLRARDDGR